MASPQGSLRQRNVPGGSSKKKNDDPVDTVVEKVSKVKAKAKGTGSEWDYKIAFTIITILAFASRFWGISHPNEVVFDEVHFGKVSQVEFYPEFSSESL